MYLIFSVRTDNTSDCKHTWIGRPNVQIDMAVSANISQARDLDTCLERCHLLYPTTQLSVDFSVSYNSCLCYNGNSTQANLTYNPGYVHYETFCRVMSKSDCYTIMQILLCRLNGSLSGIPWGDITHPSNKFTRFPETQCSLKLFFLHTAHSGSHSQ